MNKKQSDLLINTRDNDLLDTFKCFKKSFNK